MLYLKWSALKTSNVSKTWFLLRNQNKNILKHSWYILVKGTISRYVREPFYKGVRFVRIREEVKTSFRRRLCGHVTENSYNLMYWHTIVAILLTYNGWHSPDYKLTLSRLWTHFDASAADNFWKYRDYYTNLNCKT